MAEREIAPPTDASIVSITETERKYEVEDSTVVPRFADFAARPDAMVTLSAVYFDTADRALSRRATTLRRRSGGHDGG